MRMDMSAMIRNSDSDTLPNACTARSLISRMPMKGATLRTTMPMSSAHRKSGSSTPLPLSRPCMRCAPPMQARLTSNTNNSCSAVIGMNTGFSPAGGSAAPALPAVRAPARRIARSATGPESRLPRISPAVAAAMPSSSAPCRLRVSAKLAAYAAAVPWPPVRAIEPPSSPTSGCRSSSRAMLTPMAHCMTIMTTNSTSRITSLQPPRASERTSAPSPRVAKNASSSGSLGDSSKTSCALATSPSAASSSANSTPPTTGTGML